MISTSYVIQLFTLFAFQYAASSVSGDSLNGDLKMHGGMQIQVEELTKLCYRHKTNGEYQQYLRMDPRQVVVTTMSLANVSSVSAPRSFNLREPEVLVGNQLVLYPQTPTTNLEARRFRVIWCSESRVRRVDLQNGSSCNSWLLTRCLPSRTCITQNDASATRTGNNACYLLRELLDTPLISESGGNSKVLSIPISREWCEDEDFGCVNCIQDTGVLVSPDQTSYTLCIFCSISEGIERIYRERVVISCIGTMINEYGVFPDMSNVHTFLGYYEHSRASVYTLYPYS